MKIKCSQCGSEEAEKYTDPYSYNHFVEVCFGCGYVRKVSWFQMEMNNELGEILDVLDDEKDIAPETRLDSIRKVIEQ